VVSVKHGAPALNWWGLTTPTTGPTGTSTTWVGVALKFTAAGRVAGFRAYDSTGSSLQTVTCLLIDDTLSAATIKAVGIMRYGPGLTARWHQTWFRPWTRITVGNTYRLAVLYVGGGLFRTNNSLNSGPVTHNNIQFVNSFQSTALDLAGASLTLNTNANAVDLLFYPG